MIDSIKAQFADWVETRKIVVRFINELTDEELDRKLPRNVLNTIRLQAHELILFQSDIVRSLSTKDGRFTDEYIYKNLSKEELINQMNELDRQLEKELELLDGTEIIDYYGEKQNVHQFLSMFISHENMHIGQIIAFCYATGIEIPKSITEPMALEG